MTNEENEEYRTLLTNYPTDEYDKRQQLVQEVIDRLTNHKDPENKILFEFELMKLVTKYKVVGREDVRMLLWGSVVS